MQTSCCFNFEVPPELGSSFGNGKSKDGVNMAEVVLATRAYLQVHPELLIKRVQKFMNKPGWQLIWIVPYIPKFQPI